MNKNLFTLIIICFAFFATSAYAGNPDRQGEAGAGELLFNPWAKSAGFHGMNTSFVGGVEAMRINPAGIGRMKNGMELVISQTILYSGSDLKLNSAGYASKVGENGAFAITLSAVDFGDIQITTNNQPEGTGGYYSPGFFNIGAGYSFTYADDDSPNSISVGILFRGVMESLPDVNAFGLAIDAGVQYITGEDDNFKLGVSLRNIGGPMNYGGNGLSVQIQDPENDRPLTFDVRANEFEMPSMLNIGASYDYYFSEAIALTGLANFTSNAFSRDQIGAGVELGYNKQFAARVAYKKEIGNANDGEENIYTGLSGGFSIALPLNKAGGTDISLDYAYRTTKTFKGTHNFSVSLLF